MNYEYYFNDMPSYKYFDVNMFVSLIFCFIFIAILFSGLAYIFKLVYSYKLFKKMDRKGWEGLIPIYNTIIKLKVLNIPIWMILFLFVPGMNIVLSVIIAINTSIKFGKDILFTIGLIFAPVVFYPILAFDKSVFNQNINGIFDNNAVQSKVDDYGYCTKCGTKLSGIYCSRCGMKKD